MSAFLHHFALAAPLFALVLLGYALARWGGWPKTVSDALTRFVFVIALPALLFRLMLGFNDLPPVDARLLIAFFGSCLLVFIIGRIISATVFRLDGIAQSVFALGGVFSNNVMLGIPLAKVILGDAALPCVALVLVFNAMTLWTLVTISVEWAKHGTPSLHGFLMTARSVLRNPLVIGILSGLTLGVTGIKLPAVIDSPVQMIGQAAAPLSLIALGMGLVEYGVRSGWQHTVAITVIKLVVQPMMVGALAALLGLPRLETQVVVLLASVATGANVYLMARQFKSMEGPIAASLVVTTGLSAVTTPLLVSLYAG